MPDPYPVEYGPEADTPAPTCPSEASRPVLLLIDDDSMVGRLIAHSAEDLGFTAVRTTGAESFRQALRTRAPAVAVLDLCVPGGDGIEMIRFLADERFRGTVLVISGLDRRVLDAALRLGEALGLRMARPLAKPFRFDDFADRVLAPEPTAA